MGHKVIVFDFDGVLLDSVAVMFHQHKERFPDSTKEEFNRLFLGSFSKQMESLSLKYSVEAISEEEKEIRRKQYTHTKQTTTNLYDGVGDMLATLTQKYTLVINTSATATNCIPIIERLGLTPYFDRILTRDDDERKVRKFMMIAEHYQVLPTELLFVTDTVSDVMEAQELMVPTIAVTYGVHDRSFFDTTQYPCLVDVVDTVSSLMQVIKNKH